MKIQQIINQIYQASKTPYPTTPERVKVQEEFLSNAMGFQNILDIGFGDGYTLQILRKNNPLAKIHGFTGNNDEMINVHLTSFNIDGGKDMHEWLESLEDKTFDMILTRHVVEHSIMPFVVLCLLNYKLVPNGKLFIVVPQDNKEMIYYKNHYSVLSRDLWEYLFKLAGFQIRFFNSAQFQRSSNGLEWQYILKKVAEPKYV